MIILDEIIKQGRNFNSIQSLKLNNMKPALLYLRKYIEENYQSNRVAEKQTNGQKPKQKAKNMSQEIIFKEKKRYDWENTKVKEFYFKNPKSFNVLKAKSKQFSSDQISRIVEPISCQKSKNVTLQNSMHENQNQLKKVRKTIVSNADTMRKSQDESQIQQQNIQENTKTEKQVRFIINGPVQSTLKRQSNTSSQIQSQESTPQNIQSCKVKVSAQMDSQNESPQMYLQTQEIEPISQTKHEHCRMESKSMKKLGYNTLFDYLNEMRRFQSIKKKQIKQAHYYPLACMTPEIDQTRQYELNGRKQKAIIQQKLAQFQRQIKVQSNFSIKSIELGNFQSIRSVKKQKSNFSKNLSQNASLLQNESPTQMIDNKAKKFLLQYEQIVICNCANKKFFSYKLSSNTDYKSFFKFTVPLLESVAQKENNYLIGNKEAQTMGMYFCCLINASLGVRQAFFWIGKPLQYYKKDRVINVVDKFLVDVQGFSVFESDRVWIVDYHGRNSFVMKDMLNKCNELQNSVKMTNNGSKKQKLRISKRISLSMSQQLSNIETSEIFMSLLANFSQFGEGTFIKKQRNNISTRGNFKMVYNSSEVGI